MIPLSQDILSKIVNTKQLADLDVPLVYIKETSAATAKVTLY